MRRLIFSFTVAALALAPFAVRAQDAGSKPNALFNQPGDGGISKPGFRAKPGTEGGLTVRPDRKILPDPAPRRAELQDNTGVQGAPDTQSGTSAQPQRNVETPPGAETGFGSSTPPQR